MTELCPEANSSHLKVVEVSNDHLLFLSYNTSKKILDVYLKIGSGICKKVNSVPGKSPVSNLRSVVISPDKQKVLVLQGYENFLELFYIPLNGEPSYVVNSPAVIGATLFDPQFLEDSKTVLFRGHHLPGDNGVYRWSAP